MIVKGWHGQIHAIITLILLAGFAVTCVAIPVDRSLARTAATAFLTSDLGSNRLMSSTSELSGEPCPIRDLETGQVLAFVVDLIPTGYIVIGPDTRLTPIIAHSDSGTFSWDEGSMNVLLHVLRADLAARLDALSDGAISISYEQAIKEKWDSLRGSISTKTSTGYAGIVGPLIEATTWSQDAPWSYLAPIDPQSGQQSLVGCVATALAQLVNYWRYPAQISFSSTSDYTTATRHISVSASEANIQSIDYPERSFYNPSDDMMAKLSYAAGISVQMDYTSSGSGAQVLDLAYALAGGSTPIQRNVEPAIWGYESAEVRTYMLFGWGSEFVQSQAEFYQDLQQGLEEGEPAILNIVTSNTSIGHAVICDGYDSETGRYHLNLGWGGQSDGWYALPEDIPTGYNVVESGIFNIRPPADRNDNTSIYEGGVPRNDDGETSIRVSPIPLETETVFSFAEGVPTTLTVRIFTVSGQLIWERTLSGEPEITWDGCDIAGTRMANGPCIYVVSGFAGMQPFIQKGILFIHR